MKEEVVCLTSCDITCAKKYVSTRRQQCHEIRIFYHGPIVLTSDYRHDSYLQRSIEVKLVSGSSGAYSLLASCINGARKNVLKMSCPRKTKRTIKRFRKKILQNSTNCAIPQVLPNYCPGISINQTQPSEPRPAGSDVLP